MLFLPVTCSRTSCFEYIGYSVERRMLRMLARGKEKVIQMENIPLEVWRAFPSGITAHTFYVVYLKGRYPTSEIDREVAAMEDANFPASIITAGLIEKVGQQTQEWKEEFASRPQAEPAGNGAALAQAPAVRPKRKAKPV